MRKENIEAIIWAVIEVAFGLFFCGLGIWLFSLETATDTHTYGFMGLEFKGKVLAAILFWLGLVILFFSVRKMVRRIRENAVN
jgi:TRAP-type C4-dicarboxylate transport system permease small subunit